MAGKCGENTVCGFLEKRRRSVDGALNLPEKRVRFSDAKFVLVLGLADDRWRER